MNNFLPPFPKEAVSLPRLTAEKNLFFSTQNWSAFTWPELDNQIDPAHAQSNRRFLSIIDPSTKPLNCWQDVRADESRSRLEYQMKAKSLYLWFDFPIQSFRLTRRRNNLWLDFPLRLHSPSN